MAQQIFIDPKITASEQIASEPQKKHSGQVFNAILFAYLELVEAATTMSESALVRVKQLRGNAGSQQQVNNQAAQLKWYALPTAIVNHHKKEKKYGHWQAQAGGGMKWKTTHVKIIKWTTIKNNGEIQIVETKNEDQQQIRQVLTDKAQVMQQTATVSMYGENTLSNEAMSTIQQGSSLLDIAMSLTFKALLRNQPDT